MHMALGRGDTRCASACLKDTARHAGVKSIADTAIIKRIHFIYERAARKFKSDMQLWIDWLAYCKKSKSSKLHSKVGSE